MGRERQETMPGVGEETDLRVFERRVQRALDMAGSAKQTAEDVEQKMEIFKTGISGQYATINSKLDGIDKTASKHASDISDLLSKEKLRTQREELSEKFQLQQQALFRWFVPILITLLLALVSGVFWLASNVSKKATYEQAPPDPRGAPGRFASAGE